MEKDGYNTLHILKYSGERRPVSGYIDLCDFALSAVTSKISSNVQLTISKIGKLSMTVTCDYLGCQSPYSQSSFNEDGVHMTNSLAANQQLNIVIRNSEHTVEYIRAIFDHLSKQIMESHGVTLDVPKLDQVSSLHICIKGKPSIKKVESAPEVLSTAQP